MKHLSPPIHLFLVLIVTFLISGCETESGPKVTAPDGVALRFDQVGEGETSIVLVHDWASDRRIWQAQVEFLSKNYQVINVDLPGFGESGDDREDWSMATYGKDIATIVQELGLENVILVGFSMGGPVVVEAAPLIESQVKGIVLVDILHDVNFRVPPSMSKQFQLVMMDLIENPSQDKFVEGGYFKRDFEGSYQKVLEFLEEAPIEKWREVLAQNMNWMNEYSIESIKAVKAPIKAINSERFPTNEDSFREYSSAFEATIIENAGHVLMWDAADEFNQSLDSYIQQLISNP